jgi:hypothetical protein
VSISEGAIEAYERLRQRAVQLDSGDLAARRVFVRCGFAAWAQIRPATVPSHLTESQFPSEVAPPSLDSFETELVRLVAGLILTRQEVLAACLS